MAILSEQPFQLTNICDWYGVNISLKNFSTSDYYDWCRYNYLTHADDYRMDEAEDLMIHELRNIMTEIHATGPFDNQWYVEFHRVLVTVLAKVWDIELSNIIVDIKQRYCKLLNMQGCGCVPVKITITGNPMPCSKIPNEKSCTLNFIPKFDHINDWVRLITKSGKSGYIIAGPQ